MRKLAPEGATQLGVRLPNNLIKLIDEYAEKVAAEDPLRRSVTRADIIRLAVQELLDPQPTGKSKTRKRS